MQYSISDAREYLRQLREDNERCSDDVIDIYEEFIQDGNSSDLTDEKWMVLEQVVIAAFDTHREDIADECLKELVSLFSQFWTVFGPFSITIGPIMGIS